MLTPRSENGDTPASAEAAEAQGREGSQATGGIGRVGDGESRVARSFDQLIAQILEEGDTILSKDTTTDYRTKRQGSATSGIP